ncbi:hypothetical protein [Celerinatantimonas sp. MCCC 1A17872]|uniref:DUF7217 family protein n=1 Tax=Celerinatantimonas sp. MCCC 1A17872 TaxID=3177514 RepID=UPI0038C3FFE1
MNLNIPVYQSILTQGLSLTSPAVAVGQTTINALTTADAALEPLTSRLDLDVSVIDEARSVINSANSTATSSVSTIASRAEDSLRLGSLTRYVNQIDAYVNDVPSSCYNTQSAFSSVFGSCDDYFDSMTGYANTLTDKVADFLSGSLGSSDFENYLASLGDLFSPMVDGISNLLSKEASVISEIEAKVKASSLAQSIASLWNDSCTQELMATTLPDDIQGLLT